MPGQLQRPCHGEEEGRKGKKPPFFSFTSKRRPAPTFGEPVGGHCDPGKTTGVNGKAGETMTRDPLLSSDLPKDPPLPKRTRKTNPSPEPGAKTQGKKGHWMGGRGVSCLLSSRPAGISFPPGGALQCQWSIFLPLPSDPQTAPHPVFCCRGCLSHSCRHQI